MLYVYDKERVNLTIRLQHSVSIVFCTVLGYSDGMKILGIDYGTKRVGLATADTEVKMAFPKAVISNDTELIKSIKELCDKEEIYKVVLGESKDLNGNDNDVAGEIKDFKETLEREGLTVVFQPEFYTTYQASRIQGDSDMIDASAAAIILQSFMDKYKE